MGGGEDSRLRGCQKAARDGGGVAWLEVGGGCGYGWVLGLCPCGCDGLGRRW